MKKNNQSISKLTGLIQTHYNQTLSNEQIDNFCVRLTMMELKLKKRNWKNYKDMIGNYAQRAKSGVLKEDQNLETYEFTSKTSLKHNLSI